MMSWAGTGLCVLRFASCLGAHGHVRRELLDLRTNDDGVGAVLMRDLVVMFGMDPGTQNLEQVAWVSSRSHWTRVYRSS